LQVMGGGRTAETTGKQQWRKEGFAWRDLLCRTPKHSKGFTKGGDWKQLRRKWLEGKKHK